MDINIEKYVELFLETIVNWVTNYSLQVIAAILIFIIGKWVAGKISKLLSVILEKNKVDATLISFLSNITYYALMVVVLIAVAGKLGINTTSFLTILGTAGLAIGLAFKDSLSNFAAGVMLILFRPFRVGDLVSVGDATGVVKEISIFTTHLTTVDNRLVIIPNGNIVANVITNITANDTRRVDLIMGISYDDDIKKAKEIMTEIVNAHEKVLDDPPPKIAVVELADSSVNFVVRPWVKTPDYWDVYFGLTEKIKIAFDENGITIPYPQRDVHMYTEKTNEG